MINNRYYEKEYNQLTDLLTKLQPLAYQETYIWTIKFTISDIHKW